MKGVLKSFLLPPDFYADDVADMVGNCVQRHGVEEWKAVVLTNEIHGHLGIYSTLGAKMGLLSRELFREAGVEEDLSVLSYAGSVPPVSCLNDGLQVGSGASMGHGRFALAPSEEGIAVRACFMGGGKVLELSLKREYEERIQEDIRRGVELYGHSAPYWDYVRTLALRYWLEWDRGRIFTISWKRP